MSLPPLAIEGSYDIVLVDEAGRQLGSSSLSVVNDPPAVAMSKDRYASGEPLLISWRNAPGYRYDWLGVFAVDADSGALVWQHIRAALDGTTTLSAASADGVWPLPPGRYTVRLLLDDSDTVLAETHSFSIAAP